MQFICEVIPEGIGNKRNIETTKISNIILIN